MCGINGIVNFKKKYNQELGRYNEAAHLMNEAQKSRGPDSQNFYVNDKKSFIFCHQRLSILDLSEKSNQPVITNQKKFIFSFNGEVYNFKELSNEYNIPEEYCDSDTLVLSYLFDIIGIKNTLKKINGMHSIAIIDIENDYLYLSRDYYGQKPLFYYINGDQIVFCSEQSTLISLQKNNFIHLNLNKYSKKQFLKLGFFPSNMTLFENTYKVNTNSILKIHLKSGTVIEEKLHSQLTDLKKSASVDLFEKPIKRTVTSDVPVTLLLSGGIDSTLVALLVKKYTKKVINKAFCVVFDKKSDEYKNAEIVATKLNIDLEYIEFNDLIRKQSLKSIFKIFSEPLGDISIIPTYLMMQYLSKDYKVVLTGDIGDELFGGYPRYYKYMKYQKIINKIITNKKILNVFSTILYYFPFNKKIVINNYLNDFANPKSIYDWAKMDRVEFLPNNLMVKSDRASMSCGVESRTPFSDLSLIKSDNYILNFDIYKSNILKIIMKYIPEYISPKKEGFGPEERSFLSDFTDFDEIADDYIYNNKKFYSKYKTKDQKLKLINKEWFNFVYWMWEKYRFKQ